MTNRQWLYPRSERTICPSLWLTGYSDEQTVRNRSGPLEQHWDWTQHGFLHWGGRSVHPATLGLLFFSLFSLEAMDGGWCVVVVVLPSSLILLCLCLYLWCKVTNEMLLEFYLGISIKKNLSFSASDDLIFLSGKLVLTNAVKRSSTWGVLNHVKNSLRPNKKKFILQKM